MITHRASESLYTVPLSTVNGLSRLTNGQAWPIHKFSNRLITFESNWNSRFDFESNLEALQVPDHDCYFSLLLNPFFGVLPVGLDPGKCTLWNGQQWFLQAGCQPFLSRICDVACVVLSDP